MIIWGFVIWSVIVMRLADQDDVGVRCWCDDDDVGLIMMMMLV